VKTLILAVAVGALVAGCSIRSETTVQRPATQPAAIVVADPPPAGTVYVPVRTN
jgi:hypothetical protein